MKYGYIDGKKYEVQSSSSHKRVVLMKFVGVDDRNAAEKLLKKDLQVPREDLVPLKKGQHYIYDIIGSVVYDLEEHELGNLQTSCARAATMSTSSLLMTAGKPFLRLSPTSSNPLILK